MIQKINLSRFWLQSDFGKILVFERVVTRDNTGQITNEQYSASPIAELPEPGFPMGLAVE